MAEQMNTPVKRVFELYSCCRADPPYCLPLFAKDDPAMALAGDIDAEMHRRAAIFLLFPFLGLYRELVGQFLMQVQKNLMDERNII